LLRKFKLILSFIQVLESFLKSLNNSVRNIYKTSEDLLNEETLGHLLVLNCGHAGVPSPIESIVLEIHLKRAGFTYSANKPAVLKVPSKTRNEEFKAENAAKNESKDLEELVQAITPGQPKTEAITPSPMMTIEPETVNLQRKEGEE